MSRILRQYDENDLAQCLEIFDSNVPRYFHPDERLELEDYLKDNSDTYLILCENNTIVGCGGYWMKTESQQARLSWGMVHTQSHKKGFGEILLLGRLQAIISDTSAQSVSISTSQHTQGFYEKYKFVASTITPDGLSPGLDEVEMLLELNQENVENIHEQWRALEMS